MTYLTPEKYTKLLKYLMSVLFNKTFPNEGLLHKNVMLFYRLYA